MALRFVYAALTGTFEEEVKKAQKPIAVAATEAMREAGDIVRAESKSAFAAAGFGRSAQNSMRSAVTPERGESLSPFVDFTLRPGFWSVFESGAVIRGRPLLWLPTDNVPLGTGKRRLTPRQYRERVGPLTAARGTKRPILLGQASRATVLRATAKVVRLRKRAVRAGALLGAKVPMFIGVPLVNIGKRVDLEAILRRVVARFGELFKKHYKPE